MSKTLCIRCHNHPPEPGKTNCRWCAEYKSLYSAGRRDVRKVQGLCGICGGTRDDTRFTDCFGCRQRASGNAVRMEAVNG